MSEIPSVGDTVTLLSPEAMGTFDENGESTCRVR